MLLVCQNCLVRNSEVSKQALMQKSMRILPNTQLRLKFSESILYKIVKMN